MSDGILEVEYRKYFKNLLPEMALIMLVELSFPNSDDRLRLMAIASLRKAKRK